MGLQRILIFCSLLSVDNFTEIQSCHSTTTDQDYSYENLSIQTSVQFAPPCTVIHSIVKKAAKLCPLCTNYLVYSSQK